MSGDSSLLVEKLWRLKRRIDKGACPGVEFIHLNTLLREPSYRADVLRRVELSGTPELKALARDLTNPVFMPRLQQLPQNAARPPQSEFFDESANFVGAVSPVSAQSWLDGWTDFPAN